MEESLVGTVERITFQNPENGYTVVKLKAPRSRDLVTIVGKMPLVCEGETLILKGEWKNNLAYGVQFQVSSCESKLPAEVSGIKKYLASGMVKGIGPVYAKKIVETFGATTFDVIDHAPHELRKVPGIGEKRIEKILACWEEHKSIREVMFFLQNYGVSPVYAQKILKAYGKDCIDKVSRNPYGLSQDIRGIGFKKADEIASKMGIEKESLRRMEAGLEFLLNEKAADGHTCYPSSELLKEGEDLLEVAATAVQGGLENLVKEERVILKEFNKVLFAYLKPLYLSEMGILRELIRIQNSPTFLREIDTQKAVQWAQEKLYIRLAPNQQKGVKTALSEKVMILTGGPGTGKSTITKSILAVSEKLTGNITLVAPTGRAAKRMAEITGKKASTIHSLLEVDFKQGGFKKGKGNPISADLIIIDEASMIDTYLMYSLLKAIPDACRVIFVGDVDQLPSVGPGSVLKDLIDLGTLPVIKLTEIFRQAKGSQIITNAHKINRGEMPYLKNASDGDFFFMEAKEREQIVATVVGLNQYRLPKTYGFDPIDEIQVLSPMKKGPVGIEALNLALQEALNPSNNPLMAMGRRFHEGDKVMQLTNNYNKEVFNGDVGRIAWMEPVEREIAVHFEGREVIYAYSELDEITPAYAVSVHKYQGSECPCIIMPVHESHYMLLRRNLLYTGVTRGKKLVILVGSKKAIAIAVHNEDVLKRHTGLAFLKN